MTVITINSPLDKASTQIDTKNITSMNDLVSAIKDMFNINIPECDNFKLFSFGQPPRYYAEDSDIEVMNGMMDRKEIREFKISYKIREPPRHGPQEIDMSAVKNGIVKSGYSRVVHKDGESVTIGNPNGVRITIPKGALSESTKVSVKEVDMIGLNIRGNVTQHVPGDMNAINREMNK
jgi:hypothetical protein